MIGSPAIAAWIAEAAFIGLMFWAWWSGELGRAALTFFALAYIVGFVGRSYLPYGEGLFAPAVAVLDILLVLLIFKGDMKIV